MTTFLISYDLRGKDETSEDYKRLIDKIKSYSSWARPTYSDWFIVTEKSAESVRDEVKGFIDSNDRLLVTKASAPGAWVGLPDEVSTWLKNNL